MESKVPGGVWTAWGRVTKPAAEPQGSFLRRSLRRLRPQRFVPAVGADNGAPATLGEAPAPSSPPPAVSEYAPPPEFEFRILLSRLTDGGVLRRLRAYLAYFHDHPDVCLNNGDSCLSILAFLRNSGLPDDFDTLQDVYRAHLKFRGFDESMIEEDLDRVRFILCRMRMRELNLPTQDPAVGRCTCVPECCLLLPTGCCVIM